MDGKGKREGVTHQLAITKPRPEIDTCAASRTWRVLYHDQAPHIGSCPTRCDMCWSQRWPRYHSHTSMGKVLRPRRHVLRMLKLLTRRGDMLAYFMPWGRGRGRTQVSTNG